MTFLDSAGKIRPVPNHPNGVREELINVFISAGLLSVTAQDLAETIIENPELAGKLRILTGDIILRDRGLRDDD